ncbi:DUF2726 domain-containing protein [Imhoffiella purpurea]|uniref:DUF2726 domain-containing protein n=1 Tax=Imhoffiella purpurea TaxID=1249627 RepID=W9VA22_9GAMM|nr:DUF2726 domain-containing protein [Imhoffiella purpurea]EXJ13761.1 hypothetical protein D779_3300 [Imhoffiella purpurea]
MGHFYVLLGLWFILLIAMLLSLWRLMRRRLSLPYKVDPALFAPGQLAFKAVLERALGNGYRVYGKVRAADVIGLRGRLSRADQERAYIRLGERGFDFLVCSAETSAIVCALNLAPRSRFGKASPRKDVLDRICAAAGLPFVRVRESDAYSADQVASIVSGAIHAHRKRERDEALPQDEAEEMLQGLSAAIQERELDSGSRTRAQPGAARPSRVAGGAAPRRKDPKVGGSRRRDPLIIGTADVEEGPEFRIDADLDEARPLRRSRL